MGDSRGWDCIREVATDEDRERVFQFRYRIYVEEMARIQHHADHAARRIEDPLDATAVNIAAFLGEEVVGVVRVNFARDSDLDGYDALYRMSESAGAAHPADTCIVTRLMIEPRLRSGLLASRLCLACYLHALGGGTRFAFIDCNSHLVPFFTGLGFDAYIGSVAHEEYGEVLPMRLDLRDEARLERTRSPFLAVLRRWQRTTWATPSHQPHLGVHTNMTPRETLHREFETAMRQFEASPAMQGLLRCEWTADEYRSVLREIYHYAKEDPQMQALAAVRFRGIDRAQVRAFFKHAASEIGHDHMALEDLTLLGGDASRVPLTRPLPATIALTSFGFYQIDYDNPVGYLGYLYFLEFMPTLRGQRYGECLLRCGVPPEAMGFLQEHTTVDVAHNRLMERYLDALVHDEDDLEAVVYALHVTAELYGSMLTAAVARAGDPDRDARVSSTERRRYRVQADQPSDRDRHAEMAADASA